MLSKFKNGESLLNLLSEFNVEGRCRDLKAMENLCFLNLTLRIQSLEIRGFRSKLNSTQKSES